MKQAWIKKKEKEKEARIVGLMAEMQRQIKAEFGGDYNDVEMQALMDNIAEAGNNGNGTAAHILTSMNNNDVYTELIHLMREDYSYYADSEPVHFHGDIFITDPCYILNDDDFEECCHNVRSCPSGLRYDVIPGSLIRDTIWGDWECVVTDSKTGENIGMFSADAGYVGVFDADELAKYKPDCDDVLGINMACIILNFDGDVWFRVTKKHFEKYGDDFFVRVIGKGTDIQTGIPIEFETRLA